MKRNVVVMALLLAPGLAMAQELPAPVADEGAQGQAQYRMRAPGPGAQGFMQRSPGPAPGDRPGPDLGAWWKNSVIVQEIGLSEQQVTQIEQTFFDHRLKLIDLKATVEREETRLQPLMEADQVDEARIGPQIDKVLAARSALEKANVMMMLSIRKVLTVDQWKRLEELRHRRENAGRLRQMREEEGVRRRLEMTRPDSPPPAPRPPGADRRPGEAPVEDAAGRIRVDGGVLKSYLVHQVQPEYPNVARRAKIEGTVRLQAVIARDGSVLQLEVLAGHPLLVNSALEAVRQWRYEPTLRGGEPVEVISTVDVAFRLTD